VARSAAVAAETATGVAKFDGGSQECDRNSKDHNRGGRDCNGGSRDHNARGRDCNAGRLGVNWGCQDCGRGSLGLKVGDSEPPARVVTRVGTGTMRRLCGP